MEDVEPAATQTQSDALKAASTKPTSAIDANSELPSPPFIQVEGVPNFRDLGGYPCIPGTSNTPHSIRRGHVFRSAQFSRISPTGTSTMTSTLNIHTLYDFRSRKEIDLMHARYPDLPLDIPGVTRHAVPIYKDEDYTPISMAEKYALSPTSGQSRSAGFVKAYEDITRQAARSGSFRIILLHLLAHPERPLVFHCTVGKDRTGVFAALLLALCGVPAGVIVWDYALTTAGLGSWREHLIKRLMSGAGGELAAGSASGENGEEKRAPTRQEAEQIIGSHAEDMRAFLDEVVEAKFGSARAYFKEFCGFDDGQLDAIVNTLVVEGEAYVPPDGWDRKDVGR